MPCTYLAHHELESVNIIIVIITCMHMSDLVGGCVSDGRTYGFRVYGCFQQVGCNVKSEAATTASKTVRGCMADRSSVSVRMGTADSELSDKSFYTCIGCARSLQV